MTIVKTRQRKEPRLLECTWLTQIPRGQVLVSRESSLSIPSFGSVSFGVRGLLDLQGLSRDRRQEQGWSLRVEQTYSKPETEALEQGIRAMGAGSVGLYLGQNFDPRRLWNLCGVHPWNTHKIPKH